MNPIHLARTVVHWLEYQRLCGRSELFCEAYLAQPIGEYSLSLKPEHFEPEVPYPNRYQAGVRRKRSMDFAIFEKSVGGQRALRHAIETKFITARRYYTQETYDDLYRLLWFQPNREPEHCRRWFLVAGFKRNISGERFLAAKVQNGPGRGLPRFSAFTGLLSTDLHNALRSKPVHAARKELRQLWVEAASAFGSSEIPDEVTVRLSGRYPARPRPTDAFCLVWEIVRPQPDFAATFSA